MFPLSKLADLGPRTRLRKMARLLQASESSLGLGLGCDRAYLRELATFLPQWRSDSPVGKLSGELAQAIDSGSADEALLRSVNALRHALLAAVGAEPSEWDLLKPGDGLLDRQAVQVLPITVYLEDLRSPFNVGSIFRTAEAFGAERIVLSPATPLPTHPRARKTARGADRVVPWEVAGLPAIAQSNQSEGGEPASIFALEVGGTDVASFQFPSRGTVLVGSEELGLSPEALRLADAGRGRVSIPLAGAKRSLNVSVAFGILMHHWRQALQP